MRVMRGTLLGFVTASGGITENILIVLLNDFNKKIKKIKNIFENFSGISPNCDT